MNRPINFLKIWLLILIGLFYNNAFTQQCTIVFVNDLNNCLPINNYNFEQGWKLQNTSNSCNAVDYKLTPEHAEYFETSSGQWLPYSEMGFLFHRVSSTADPNYSEFFSIPAGGNEDICINFNVSPADINREYRVYFDIYDGNGNVLPPLNGGQLFTQFVVSGANLMMLNENISPNSACPDDQIVVTGSVKNDGDSSADTCSLQIWFSDDNNLNTSVDELIHVVNISALQPNEEETFSNSIPVPSNANSGTRYIFLKIDAYSNIPESSESDNEESASFTVQNSGCVSVEDLFLTNVFLDLTELEDNEFVEASWVLNYSGSSTIYLNPDIGNFLSTDCNWDANDLFLEGDSNEKVNVFNPTNSGTDDVEIPLGTECGCYNILTVADYNLEVAEVNENNNVECNAIEILCRYDFDLNFDALSVSEIYSGNSLTATVTQLYDSNSPINITSQVGFFLSSDITWDANDVFLGVESSTHNNTNTSANLTENIDIPLNTFPGDYYILFVADYVQNIAEKNENNNIEYRPLRILHDPTNNNFAYPEHNYTSKPALACDPVDMSTGAFIWAENDMSIGGVNGTHSFRRFYNSRNNYNNVLGWNWTHSYDISLEIDGNAWTVQFGNGKKAFFAGYSDGSTVPLYAGTMDTLYFSNNIYTFEKQNGVKYAFDSNGVIQTITNRNGNVITFSYSSGQLSTVSFDGGRQFSFTSTNGKITQVVDNIGRTIEFDYNGNDDLIWAKNVRGDTTFFNYDNNHQLQTVINPNGHTVVQNVYDASNRISSQQDVFNNLFTIDYDTPSTGVTTATNPFGDTQEYHHNSRYNLTKFVDELGNDIFLGYFNDNNLIKSFKDAENNSTFYTYDENDKLRWIVDAEQEITKFSHNILNLPDTITNALGHKVVMEYDSDGNPITVIFSNGGQMTATYNSLGQIISQTSANGHVTTFQYLTTGEVESVTTPTGTILYGYDNIGRLISVTDRNGKSTTFTLDEKGNILVITDPMGYTIEMLYDKNDNLISYKDKNGNYSTLTYDARDRLTQATDPLGYNTTFTYDVLDRLLTVTDGNNNTVSYSYDAKGQVISVTDSLGTQIFEYDDVGNLDEIIDALNAHSYINYDDKYRPTSITDALGNVTTNIYDAIDQIISQTDANGNTTLFSYNNMGWLDSMTNAIGGVTTFGYDMAGNMDVYTDANNHITNYTFNSLNLPISKTYAGGYTSTSQYDNEGNLTIATDENGLTTTYTRNDNYEITGINFSNGATYSFSYDNEGRTIGMTNVNGTTIIQRDARGLVIQVTDPFTDITQFGYDAVGNRTSVTYPNSNIVTTQFNAVNLPIQISDWLGNNSQRNYDANGNLTGITNSNGTYTTIVRDAVGRVSSYSNFQPDATVINSHALTYDNVGNIIQDQRNVILQPNFTSQNLVNSYGLDDRLTTSGNNTFTRNGKGAVTAISGNINESQTWGENDLLVSYTQKGKIITNEFNPLSQRTKKTVDGTVTQYTLDISNNLSTILQEKDNQGGVLSQYVYAPDGLGWRLDAQGNAQFYHFDYIGHTLALTDASGEVTDAYATDAFGDFFAHLGNTVQPFDFLGKYGIENEGEGQYHIRARDYNAAQGRFISKDALTSFGTNKYSYGLNNPFSLIDIDGYSPINYGAGAVAGFNNLGLTNDISGFNISNGTVPYAYDAKTQLAAVENFKKELQNTNNYTAPLSTQCEGQRRLTLLEVLEESAGEFVDGFNFLLIDDFYACRNGDNFACAALATAGIPAGKIIKGGRYVIKGGKTYVYVSKNADGVINYVGITDNLIRRAKEHLRKKGIEIESILSKLPRSDAKAVEQAIIQIQGLGKNGGTLLNKINSISKNNPDYAKLLNRGYEILKSIGINK